MTGLRPWGRPQRLATGAYLVAAAVVATGVGLGVARAGGAQRWGGLAGAAVGLGVFGLVAVLLVARRWPRADRPDDAAFLLGPIGAGLLLGGLAARVHGPGWGAVFGMVITVGGAMVTSRDLARRRRAMAAAAAAAALDAVDG